MYYMATLTIIDNLDMCFYPGKVEVQIMESFKDIDNNPNLLNLYVLSLLQLAICALVIYLTCCILSKLQPIGL